MVNTQKVWEVAYWINLILNVGKEFAEFRHNCDIHYTVLRIQLILMRIRILDPGSALKLADLTEPDPKHWWYTLQSCYFISSSTFILSYICWEITVKASSTLSPVLAEVSRKDIWWYSARAWNIIIDICKKLLVFLFGEPLNSCKRICIKLSATDLINTAFWLVFSRIFRYRNCT